MSKNTVLGEDAEIYQKRARANDLESLKGLPLRKKIRYFKDYYLKALIVSGIALAVIIYLIYKLVGPKDDILLHAVIVNDSFTEEHKDTFIQGLAEALSIDLEKNQISIEDNLTSSAMSPDAGVQQQIAVYSYAGTLDIMIADETYFKRYARDGFFLDLSTVLNADEIAYLKDDLLYSTLTPVPEEDLLPGEEQIDTTVEHAYGVCLDNSSIYTGLSNIYEYQKDKIKKRSFYIGIVANSSQVENSTRTIKYLKDMLYTK